MKNQAWRSTGNAVFLLNYHFVWSTKYPKPVLSPAGIMQVLRGKLAYILFREFPDLRKQLWGGSLWNPSYDVRTAGEVSAQMIVRTIESHKTI